MVIFRCSFVSNLLGSLGVKGTFELCVPVEIPSCIRHLVVNIPCAGDSLRNIRRMSRNLRCNYSLLNIVKVRKCKVLCRSNIAEECRAAHSRHGSSDCRCDMVISGSNICNKRSQYIEGSAHTDSLLYLHIGCHLVERHMAGTFHHNLYVMAPRSLGKFTQSYKLFYLTYICRVCKTAGATGIAQ